jgi:hypothetical protein
MGTTLVSNKKSWRTFPQIWVEELRNPHLEIENKVWLSIYNFFEINPIGVFLLQNEL